MDSRELAHDPSGWHNWCAHRCADGMPCDRWTWHAWIPSYHTSVKWEPDKLTRHVHRQVAAEVPA